MNKYDRMKITQKNIVLRKLKILETTKILVKYMIKYSSPLSYDLNT